MRDRLIQLIMECSTYTPEYTEQVRLHAEYLAQHLLNEGVIVPPCKVGDTVYCIERKIIRKCLVKMVKSLTYENVTRFFVEAECEIESPFYSDGRKIKHGLMAVWEIEWGSWYRAFLTREEAEKALAERSENE